MLMVANGDDTQFKQNLLNSGSPEWFANLMSIIPKYSMNFWIWLLVVGVFCVVIIIDWKFPHLFPKRFRRVGFSKEQKAGLPALLKDVSDILTEVLHCPNMSEKNKSAKSMLGKVTKLRSKTSSLPSGNLSFSILDYCKYSDRVWTMGRYDIKDLKKMEKIRDRIAKMVSRYTD